MYFFKKANNTTVRLLMGKCNSLLPYFCSHIFNFQVEARVHTMTDKALYDLSSLLIRADSIKFSLA